MEEIRKKHEEAATLQARRGFTFRPGNLSPAKAVGIFMAHLWAI